MWSRAALKQNAKEVLKQSYWTAFAAGLIYSLITGGLNSGTSGNASVNYSFDGLPQDPSYYFDRAVGFFVPLLFMGALFAVVLSVVLRFFVFNPLEVGVQRYFLEGTQYRFHLGEIGFAFQNGYVNVAKTMFFRDLHVFLWSLLLVIPGIIKAYSYRLVPYILSENPDMDTQRALELSKQMTSGHKMDIFVLDLSFFGWYFLVGIVSGIVGFLTFGLGFVLPTLFFNPYPIATDAQLYLALRAIALDRGITSLGELAPRHRGPF